MGPTPRVAVHIGRLLGPRIHADGRSGARHHASGRGASGRAHSPPQREQGESFSQLLQPARASGPTVPVSSVLSTILHGLHAAHQTKNERGEPLGIVQLAIYWTRYYAGEVRKLAQ